MLLFSQTLEFGFLQFILVALTWQCRITKNPNSKWIKCIFTKLRKCICRNANESVKPCCQIFLKSILTLNREYWLVKFDQKSDRPRVIVTRTQICWVHNFCYKSASFSYPRFFDAVNCSQCQFYFLIQVLGRRRRWRFVKVMMSTLVSQEQSRW